MSTPVVFHLAEADLAPVQRLLTKGRESVRTQNRARVLLLAHQGLSPEAVAAAALVSRATVYNVWTRYRAEGLAAALYDRPRPGQPRKVTPRVEAAITHLACSQAPDGADRWSLRLLRERLVVLGHELSEESVRLVLKKVSSSPGSAASGALAK
jgi:transposase